MREPLRHRLASAMMLVLLLLGGQAGIGLDAFLFHGEASAAHQPHVEEAGAACHAEVCLEWLAGVQARQLGTAAHGVPLAEPVTVVRPTRTPFVAAVTRSSPSTLPRSPPASHR